MPINKKSPRKTRATKTKKASTSTKKRKPRSPVDKDPATDYARKVLAKKIVAGPHVRAACNRHLEDIKHQKKRGIVWDKDEALKALRYFMNVLHLAGGDFEGTPFLPEPWEEFVICSIFGWKTKDGYRRFTTAFIETGKGSGKSPLAAGVGLKMLASDGQARAEVYAVATKRDQAMILFRDAVSMYEQSPELKSRLRSTGAKGREWNLYYPDNGSFFRPISSENTGKGQSGPRPYCNLFDEVHEHPTNAMIEFMSAGKKSNRQALDFMITNSGHDRKSVCYQYHEYACKVVSGETIDESFFGYVCALDEGDDPFKDESCWKKVNPSLPKIPGMPYLRDQVRKARGMPSKESIVRRLNFCEWVDAEDPWIGRDRWLSVLKKLDIKKFHGKRCVCAIDLSGRSDLTALSQVFKENGVSHAFQHYWTPKDTLRERESRDRSPYQMWVKEGYLNAVPGNSIDYAWVAHQIKGINEVTPIEILAFDRYRIHDLIRELDELDIDCYLASVQLDDDGREVIVPAEGYYTNGIAMVPHGQGYKDMAPAVDDLEAGILNEIINIDLNPVTNMCSSNAVLSTDPAGGRKFTKQKSNGRIDGIISLTMANRIARFLGAQDNLNIDNFLNSPLIL